MFALSNYLIALVALLHFYFFILESFFWTRPLGLKTFRMSLEKAKTSKSLAVNQGLYNSFLAVGLIWGLLVSDINFSFQIKIFFLSCITIAGIIGALTVNKKIFFIQSAPAIVALVLCMANL